MVRDIRIPYTAHPGEAIEKAKKQFTHALGRGRSAGILDAVLYKTSIDARKKPDILRVCTVLLTVELAGQDAAAICARDRAIGVFEQEMFSLPQGSTPMDSRPVIVGFGPAGMFCALLLCEAGFAPIIVERGDDVDDRAAAVERFYRTRMLDTDSNIQFGAGGAGTFSDGKLVTRIGDPKCTWVLEKLAAYGAPNEILTKAKPHIGTDILLRVVGNIRDDLRARGCEFRFRTTMQQIVSSETVGGTHARAIRTQDGEIPCGALVLALGHSARDTYRMLYERGILLQPKPFSIGVRIEHLQSALNEAAYGSAARDTLACGAVGGGILLPPAEYTVSHRPKPTADDPDPRGVYSFCMCPGGEVMAAASEGGGVVVNGMSRFARDGRNANAALAVSVRTADYGNHPMQAIAYQRALEQKAFAAGGGDYSAPCQTVGDFLAGRHGTYPTDVLPSYMNGGVRMCDLHTVLPEFVTSLLADGIRRFDRQYPGFSSDTALLTGVETRTSAPVRIPRGEDFTALGCENIYPIGEGAGYAGGITSAAVDGVNAAIALLSKYRH
ncbi:MAG: hypothetical protein E7604_03945 [Ruminococcaceae bacterium]|nr:hypothetical protein [Oscillospiraceae bacterium]